MRKFLGNAATALSSILVALIALELFLRLAKPQIYEVHPPGLYNPDPDVGYVLTPGFKGNLKQPEFDTVVSTNGDGLRGAELRPKHSNTRRILLLGDSQTWGFGVNDDETYAVQLEALLAERYPDWDIQVLNGGVPGYGTVDEFFWLRSRGSQLQPDLIIVQFLSVNDLLENRLAAVEWSAIEDGFLTMRDSAVNPNDKLNLLESLKHELKKNSHLAALSLESVGYLATRLGILGQVDALWGEDFTTEDAELGITYLNQIAQASADLGACTLLMYTTGKAQVIADSYIPPRSRRVVENAAEESRIPWMDATALLQQDAHRLELYFPRNGHWTRLGHQVVAELLSKEIVNLELLAQDCRPSTSSQSEEFVR